MRFRFIAAEKAVFPVRVLCRTLQVSRAGFYAWQARPPAPRARADERLGLEIAAIHAETRQRYGSPRIHAELGERGCRTGRKRVARLMRVRGLAARRRRRFRVTTQARTGSGGNLNPGVYETGASPDGRSPSFSRGRRTGPGIVPFYQRRRPTILGVVPLLGSPRRWFYRR